MEDWMIEKTTKSVKLMINDGLSLWEIIEWYVKMFKETIIDFSFRVETISFIIENYEKFKKEGW